MTAAELIKKLEKLPKNTELYSNEWGLYTTDKNGLVTVPVIEI